MAMIKHVEWKVLVNLPVDLQLFHCIHYIGTEKFGELCIINQCAVCL